MKTTIMIGATALLCALFFCFGTRSVKAFADTVYVQPVYANDGTVVEDIERAGVKRLRMQGDQVVGFACVQQTKGNFQCFIASR